MSDCKKMYIGGAWVDAMSGQFYDDCDPYTGEVFAGWPTAAARIPAGPSTPPRPAFPMWKAYNPVEKRKLLNRRPTCWRNGWISSWTR